VRVIGRHYIYSSRRWNLILSSLDICLKKWFELQPNRVSISRLWKNESGVCFLMFLARVITWWTFSLLLKDKDDITLGRSDFSEERINERLWIIKLMQIRKMNVLSFNAITSRQSSHTVSILSHLLAK